jgi:hypothetical protein
VFLTNYYSVDQITKNEMGRVSGTCGGEGKCIWGFGEETPKGKSSLGRPRRKWEDSIKMDP